MSQRAFSSPLPNYWHRPGPDVLSTLWQHLTLFSSRKPDKASQSSFSSQALAVKLTVSVFCCFLFFLLLKAKNKRLNVQLSKNIFLFENWQRGVAPLRFEFSYGALSLSSPACDSLQTASQSNCAKQTRLPCPRYEKQTSGLVNLPSGRLPSLPCWQRSDGSPVWHYDFFPPPADFVLRAIYARNERTFTFNSGLRGTAVAAKSRPPPPPLCEVVIWASDLRMCHRVGNRIWYFCQSVFHTLMVWAAYFFSAQDKLKRTSNPPRNRMSSARRF